MKRRDRIEAALRVLAPRIPGFEFGAVVDRALDSPGLKPAFPEKAAWLALTSYVRHVLTDYDALLAEGYDRDSARHFVLADTNEILKSWGAVRLIEEEDPEPLPPPDEEG